MAGSEHADTMIGPDADVVNIRIRRGARAIGSDGEFGAVQQIVVDQATGELRGVVVRRASDGAEFDIPADLITRATGDEVRFRLFQSDIDGRPDLARPYQPDQYIPVQPGNTAPRVEAAGTAQTAERPVVTSVERDAATLMTASSSLPRGQATPTDSAVTQTVSASRGAEIGEETRMPAPAREESETPGVAGDLIGGKPSSGGIGSSSTVIGSDTSTPAADQPEDTLVQLDTLPRRQAQVASALPAPDDDLSDLSDDELSNPDAALINPQPGAVDRVARPFEHATPSPAEAPDTGARGISEQDRAGMKSAFRTATNTSADDTHFIRDPALTSQDAPPQAPVADDPPTLPEPTATSDTTTDIPAANIDYLAPELSVSTGALPPTPTPTKPIQRMSPAQASAGIVGALVAGNALLRLLRLRRLRAFGEGALLGGALALVLAPMRGARLREQLADAASRLREQASSLEN